MALEVKQYPDDYSNDVRDVLAAMSFGKDMVLVGSSPLRSQLYAGDYDGFEIVKVRSLSDIVRRFQSIILQLKRMKGVYIGDIKAGIVPEWDVLKDVSIKDDKVIGYDPKHILASLADLKKRNIINAKEYKDASVLIKAVPTPGDYFVAKAEIKFHIIRWTPAQAAIGHRTLRDGRKYTLSDALTSPSLAKIDVISLVAGSRFTEFSAVYEFTKGKEVLNPTPRDITKSLLDSIKSYTLSGNYFKVLKRMFSLARYKNNKDMIAKLAPIFNGDLGRLYIIISDIDVLLYMLEHYDSLPTDEIRFEIDQFINRLSNVSLPPLVGKQPTLNKAIRKIETLSPAKMAAPLMALKDTLYKLLQQYAKPISEEFSPLALSGGSMVLNEKWDNNVWDYLHIIASHHNLEELRKAFKDVIENTTCSECRLHTSDYLMSHPLKEPTDRYVWEFHNDVNRLTGKQIVPFDIVTKYKNAVVRDPPALAKPAK